MRTIYIADSHKLLRHSILGFVPKGGIHPSLIQHGGAAHGVLSAARKDAVLRLLDALQVGSSSLALVVV